MSDESVFYLSDVVDVLRQRKRVVFVSTGVALLIGLFYAVFSTPVYIATATLQIAANDSRPSGLSARLGAAAALAGVDLDGGEQSKDRYLAVVRSRGLAERFITEHDLLPHLFPDQWDAESAQWVELRPGVVARVRGALGKLMQSLSGDAGATNGESRVPSMWKAYQIFDGEIRTVREDLKTRTIIVSFEFRDPRLAAQWVNDYVDMANHRIQMSDLREATRALNHLRQEVEKTSLAGLRSSLYGLMETQLERITLANAREEYAFEIIDRAVVPEQRARPRRGIIILVSAVAGGMVGILAALALSGYQGMSRRTRDAGRANTGNDAAEGI